MREQNHVADGLRIGQQHDQAVDTDAAAAGRRQAEFHGADVVGIIVHGFIVAGVFLCHLRLEAFGLVFRIVQLGVAVCQFAADNEKLEALGQTRFAVRCACQWRYFDRVVDDESRVPQFAFCATFKQGKLQAAGYRVKRLCAVDMFPRTNNVEAIALLQKEES